MPVSEFEIIRRYLTPEYIRSDQPFCGVGDDAALITVPDDMQLAVSTDMLLEGVHFQKGILPEDLGYKALAVNLSDMAAMAAKPQWVSLALSIPKPDEEWIKRFMEGFYSLAHDYEVMLIGGDLTRGPLTVCVHIEGIVKPGKALRRSGARVGDLIYVSGTLGDAGRALELQSGNSSVSDAWLESRLYRPSPRVMLALSLQGIASSAIDISDGLVADLGHILESSKVGAELDVDLIPLSDPLRGIDREHALELALTAGDDYELCFTVNPENIEQMKRMIDTACPVSHIGMIDKANKGLILKGKHDIDSQKLGGGYRHF